MQTADIVPESRAVNSLQMFSGVEPTDLIACYHNLQFRIVMF